jgi:hypothetical protein
MDSIHHYLRYAGLAKGERPGARIVEQAIHRKESRSRSRWRRKAAAMWQAVVQAPGEKDGFIGDMVMRQAARMESGPKWIVAIWR